MGPEMLPGNDGAADLEVARRELSNQSIARNQLEMIGF